MNLEQNYNRDDFLSFLKSFIPKFLKDIRRVATNGLQVTKEASYLGESPELNLSVFEITHSSSADARVALAMDGFRVMKNSATYRALMIYRAEKGEDWRLSLMTATPDINKKGKIGQVFSNPRRFSFFLGPNAKVNTPYQFLIKQGTIKDFAELQERFSIEVVSKEFYQEIAELFTKLVGGIRGAGSKKKKYKGIIELPFVDSKSQISHEFGVRLIGRIIFCWFLREKKSDSGLPLVPKKLLSLDSAQKTKDFYHTKLEPLFFEVLNRPIESRKEQYSKDFYVQIPYLNGGLFLPKEHDFYSFDEGSQSINHNIVKIPDEWLVELFKVLERYNFTVDENTSVDVDLSIDPEMLGRIFENLLAEINPETGESARKSTGSYYTPRAIVEYMVDESLYQYLKEKTGVSEDKLRALSSYDLSDDESHPLNEGEKEQVVEALSNITILDPACGSGAFPIGAMQKIVFMLQRVDPNANLWFKNQITNTAPEVRRLIEREFKNKNFDYIRKLGVIRRSIFGVDIQPIATEISRLRCFLTLVVEESVKDDNPNRDIEPLPNLDFKFVTANSLIGLPQEGTSVKQQGLFGADEESKIKELKIAMEGYFNSHNSEGEEYKNWFYKVRDKLFEHAANNNSWNEKTQYLSTWDPFGHNPSSWFDPEWMFGIKDGFDIVIGNPPYITYKGKECVNVSDADVRQLISLYPNSAEYKVNSYALFVERGVDILKKKGTLIYIIPSTILQNEYLKKIRKYLITKYHISQIVSFANKVFGAVTDSIILKVENNHSIGLKTIAIRKNDLDFPGLNDQKIYDQDKWNDEMNDFVINLKTNKDEDALLDKIGSNSELIDDYFIVYVGIVANGIKKFLFKTKQSTNCKKYLQGKHISNFVIYPENLFIDFVIEKLHSNTDETVYLQKEKILVRKTGNKLIAALDDEQYYTDQSIYNLYPKNGKLVNLKVITGLLNSHLLEYYFNKKMITNPDVFPYIKGIHLKKLPLKFFKKDSEGKKFETLVQKIIEWKKIGKDTGEYEKQINQMVYKLYGLRSEERKIIEENYKN